MTRGWEHVGPPQRVERGGSAAGVRRCAEVLVDYADWLHARWERTPRVRLDRTS